MAFSKLFLVGLVALLAVMVAAPHAEAAIGYGQVVGALSPCRGYLTGRRLDPRCCPGIRSLKRQARTRQDRQSVCRILKAIAPSFGNNYGKAQGLLSTCRVSLGYPLSPNVNCARVN